MNKFMQHPHVLATKDGRKITRMYNKVGGVAGLSSP